MVTCTYKVKSHHKSLGKQIQAIISDVKSKQELSWTIQGKFIIYFVLFSSLWLLFFFTVVNLLEKSIVYCSLILNSLYINA